MRCCRKCGDSNPTINIRNKKCENSILGKNWKQMVISEVVNIKEMLPDIGSIISVNILGQIKSSNVVITPDTIDVYNAEGTKLTGYKMSVRGVLVQTITYESEVGGQLVTVKNEKEFSTFIVMDPKYDFKNKIPCINVCIEDMLVDKISCREILKNVAILIQVS